MNIEKLKLVVTSDYPNDVKEQLILTIIAEDKNAINYILNLLNEERRTKDELIKELNLLLSKSYLGLNDKKVNKNNFIQKEIDSFYEKWSNFVNFCFKK